ncbi:MAG TPA: hypothetical protein VNM90_16830 [Haliangium sp.]|nr:hypothetical protein [Haliangium sp.]
MLFDPEGTPAMAAQIFGTADMWETQPEVQPIPRPRPSPPATGSA